MDVDREGKSKGRDPALSHGQSWNFNGSKASRQPLHKGEHLEEMITRGLGGCLASEQVGAEVGWGNCPLILGCSWRFDGGTSLAKGSQITWEAAVGLSSS